MTATHPAPSPASESPRDPTTGSSGKRPSVPKSKSQSSPLERARSAARKLLGRDRDKAKKEDPNIYPLF